MSVIVVEVRDFPGGLGHSKIHLLCSTSKKIAKAIIRMDKGGHTTQDHCPNEACKQDLLASQQCIALYCHQLNICSKVIAKVENHGGELIISGVDSAMSLIWIAKNFMNVGTDGEGILCGLHQIPGLTGWLCQTYKLCHGR